jgi:hypothetical protein
MNELLITFLFFIFIFTCHIVLHRFLTLWGIRTVHTLWCYVAGEVVLFFLWHNRLLLYPVSTVVVYTLLSFGISISYMSFFLGAQTPATMIVRAFAARKTLTMRSILALFNKQYIFEKRIDNLLSSGLVKRRGMRYTATTNGTYIAALIRWYQFLFHRPAGG